MKSLFVMYDAHCGVCRGVREWLQSQPTYLPLRPIPSALDAARRSFPWLPPGELAVINDSGEVWLGDHAFIMCLRALRNYRRWASRLASLLLRPLARQAVSHSRRNVSAVLGPNSEAELKQI